MIHSFFNTYTRKEKPVRIIAEHTRTYLWHILRFFAGKLFVLLAVLACISSCQKDLLKVQTKDGVAPVLSTSLDTSANHAIKLSKSDSAKSVLKITWTDPKYLSDLSHGSLVGNYLIEIDTAGNFNKPKVITMGNKLDTTFRGYDLNAILLSMDCSPGIANNVFVRIRSIFFNADTLVSNVYQIQATPYITPKIAVPAALYITGAAIPAGWVTPFPDNQKFTKVNATTFTLTISLLGGKEYELITDVNGSNWTPCYRLDPSVNPADVAYGGSFVWDGNGSPYNWSTKKFLTPPADATYQLTFDFLTATFTVTNVSSPPKIAVPSALYITGAAIPAGWVTPFPDTQKFTQVDATTFTLTIALLGGKEYELITDVNGVNWTPCYRLDPSVNPADVVNGGSFVWDGNGSSYNWSSKKFVTPAADATYKLTFNFQTATFTVQ